MNWTLLSEALLPIVAAGIVFAAWTQARRRERRAMRALRTSEERFRNLTALSADWFWETDAEQCITWLTGGPAVLAFFGAGLAFGKRLWDLPGVELDGRAFTAHLEQLRRRLPFFDLELARADAGGVRHVHLVSGQPRHDAAGNFLGYRGVGRDVTGQIEAREALAERERRFHDMVEACGEHVWQTDAPARSRATLALVLFDLERFKLVNDSLGHQAGDALLREMAERLRSALRREDALARLGGDEFVLPWDGLKSAQEAGLVAHKGSPDPP